MKTSPICRHCKNKYKARSGRNLCRTCWDDINIRKQYDLVASFGGEAAGSLAASQMTDEAWIETLLISSAAQKLQGLGGRDSLDLQDIAAFFGSYDHISWSGWERLRRIEEKEKVPQNKINYTKFVADMLTQRIAQKSLILEKALSRTF